MFHPISIPFGCVMLFNVVDLKEGVTVDDVEMTLGEMCNVVKNKYGDDEGGFIAGVTRAMARERIKYDVAADAPVRIVRFADGRLGLRDDFSGWRVELLGFGADNTAAFDRLLNAAIALDQG